MKTDIASTIQTLSSNATILGADGLIEATGLTVQLVTEPYASEYDSRYIIGRTEHVAQDVVHEGDEIRSLAAGWTVRLNTMSQAAAIMGRKGRAVNSEAQKAAAKENGRKGGRPGGRQAEPSGDVVPRSCHLTAAA